MMFSLYKRKNSYLLVNLINCFMSDYTQYDTLRKKIKT